jgi:hypothetical protein
LLNLQCFLPFFFSLSPGEKIFERAGGRPFRWAQKLCGLDFLQLEADFAKRRSQINVASLLSQLKSRWNSAKELEQQLESLGTRK